jgi:hypothetical protein
MADSLADRVRPPTVERHPTGSPRRARKRHAEVATGATTIPAPDRPVWLNPVEAACVLGFCGWKGENLETVESVEEYFGALCLRADQVLGAHSACRYFLNWYDDTPRERMRRELLAEVVREQTRRAERAAAGLDPELFIYSPGQAV